MAHLQTCTVRIFIYILYTSTFSEKKYLLNNLVFRTDCHLKNRSKYFHRTLFRSSR